MFSGFIWMLSRMDKKFESNSSELKEIKKEISDIGSRMSRLEGSFSERGYWESRDKKIGE